MLNHYRLSSLKDLLAERPDWYKVEVQDQDGNSLGYVFAVEDKENQGDCVLVVDGQADISDYECRIEELKHEVAGLEEDLWEYKQALREAEEQLENYREDKE